MNFFGWRPPWQWKAIVFLLLLATKLANAATANTLTLYIDADQQKHSESAFAIELGLRTALQEVNNQVAGYQLEVISLDHRGNTNRSKLTLDKYLRDEQSLAIIGGLHSAPYLKYRRFLHENRILTLLPWSAAGPLTRVEQGENWIFRLSIDDTKAANRIVDSAINDNHCTRPGLVLWDSGWGRTNHETLKTAFNKAGKTNIPYFYFPGSLHRQDAALLAAKLVDANIDCALMVANVEEGATIIESLASLESPPTVLSHWGITGGNFKSRVSAEIRSLVNLQFLQTCHPFGQQRTSKRVTEVWQTAQGLEFNKHQKITDLTAPAGFVHAYDLGKILIAALDKHPGVPDIKQLRLLVHNSLENLHEPINGLMKIYEKPFSNFTVDNQDAHEALDLSNLCMAYYDSHGVMEITTSGQGGAE